MKYIIILSTMLLGGQLLAQKVENCQNSLSEQGVNNQFLENFIEKNVSVNFNIIKSLDPLDPLWLKERIKTEEGKEKEEVNNQELIVIGRLPKEEQIKN